MYLSSLALYLIISFSTRELREVSAYVTDTANGEAYDTVPANDCNVNPINIQFIVDLESIGTSQNFWATKAFIKDIANAFEMGPEKTQIAVHTFVFSTYVLPRIMLNDYTNKRDFFMAMDTMSYGLTQEMLRSGEFFDEMILGIGFHKNYGGRHGVMNINVVITDGEQISNMRWSKEDAAEAQKKQIRMIVIGVGNKNPALKAMASNPSRYIDATSFATLSDVKQQLLGSICEVCPFWAGLDAILIDWHCYTLINSPLSWENAQDACKAEAPNATLAPLRSETVKAFVAMKTQEANRYAWLGASDIAEEGKFVWAADGDEANIDSTWWGQGQPDDGWGVEDCLIMRMDGTLNDYGCWWELPFFCESADVVP